MSTWSMNVDTVNIKYLEGNHYNSVESLVKNVSPTYDE